MKNIFIYTASSLLILINTFTLSAQRQAPVKLERSPGENSIPVIIDGKLFTRFLYPGSLEKPVLYPIFTASGINVTRGFPLNPQPGDPTDHPHHIGAWFNFENVNGLDFWNNSYAIPADKKHLYGWIKTDKIVETTNGNTGILSYHANWANQKNEVLAEETTRFEFSGTAHQRIIDRVTIITADTLLVFTDSKDGMLGVRLAHALQLPTDKDQTFTDDKGNTTIVKGGTDTIANGNYISSEGKTGNDVWSTRARWCKVYCKIGLDSVSVVIVDHPGNPNYPTFWHARGYGLFAANPLGEKIFTGGKSVKNLTINKGGSIVFRYRIIVDEGRHSLSNEAINKLADKFAGSK